MYSSVQPEEVGQAWCITWLLGHNLSQLKLSFAAFYNGILYNDNNTTHCFNPT